MSGESFEDIISNVFDPEEQNRYEAAIHWAETGLARQCTMIDPNSAVAERGLVLFDERKKADEDYSAMDTRLRENPFDDNVSWLLAETSRLQYETQHSTTRLGIFKSLYQRIQEEMQDTPADKRIDYEDAIMHACAAGITAIERDPYKLKMLKNELSSLVNELGMLYRLEPGRHFTAFMNGEREF